MPVHVVRNGSTLIGMVTAEDGHTDPVDISPVLVLGGDLHRLLDPVVADMNLQRSATIRTRLNHLKQFGEGLVRLECRALPKSTSDWQNLVLSIHHFLHTRSDRKQTLATRHLGVWAAARRVFSILAENDIMPMSVHLPPVQEALVLDAQPEQLIGDEPLQSVEDVGHVHKLLLPISLARSDADYLDEVRQNLVARREVLFSALHDYWQVMKENLSFGRNLRASLSEPEVIEVLRLHTENGIRHDPCSTLEGLAEHLVILERLYDGCAYRYRGKTAEGRGELINIARLPRVAEWPIAQSLPRNFCDRSLYSDSYLTWWWLGRISSRDAAIIVALLMMLHPSWTPSALFDAQISNRDGKTYLDMGEAGLSFEVEKGRAKAMKHETLNALSEDVLTMLVEVSAPLRTRLESEGHVLAGRLFLPYAKPNVAGVASVSRVIPTAASSILSGAGTEKKKKLWFGDLYPSLIAVGLGVGTVNYKKIRATEGVLEWFRTKSLRAAAKKLGNSERVVIEHYIPRALLQAWSARAVRRYQNMWIVAAAAGEEFLLDVTDFSSLSDLNEFVADILQLHAPDSSPLAAELHLRMKSGLGQIADERRGDLHVSLSLISLSALYRYQAAALASGVAAEVLAKVDARVGLAPEGLIQLADLLQLQLPKDRNPKYRSIHEQAMVDAADADRLRAWTELFASCRHGTSD